MIYLSSINNPIIDIILYKPPPQESSREQILCPSPAILSLEASIFGLEALSLGSWLALGPMGYETKHLIGIGFWGYIRVYTYIYIGDIVGYQ